MADQSLTTGRHTQQGGWFRNVFWPVTAVCALGGVAFGLYMFLGTQPFVYRIPPSVGGTGMEGGVGGGGGGGGGGGD